MRLCVQVFILLHSQSFMQHWSSLFKTAHDWLCVNSFLISFAHFIFHWFMLLHDTEKSKFQPCNYSNPRQRKSFFFISTPSFLGVVASVRLCLYLLIYKVLIIRHNFAAWNVTECSCRFLSVLRYTRIARQRVIFYPGGFGTERCPHGAKCIRIWANSKMCCLHRKTSFAAYNLLLFQRGFSSPKSGKTGRH